MTSNHILVGLTGSIATGKSTVADLFQKKGGYLIDFDVLSRKIVEPEKPAWRDIKRYFGNEVIRPDRQLDREKLGSIVFNNQAKRSQLEKFTHPRIQQEYQAELNGIIAENRSAIIFAVVPLLIEVGMVEMFEKIVVVVADGETQLKRLTSRDGISNEEALKKIESQIPVAEKIKYADYVVNNGKSRGETEDQVNTIWEDLISFQKEKR